MSEVSDKRLEKVHNRINQYDIRFPVATIAGRTKFDRGYISAVLKGKKPMSDNFWSKFDQAFPEKNVAKPVPEIQQTGNTGTPPNPDPSKVVLTGAHVTLQDYIDKQEQRIAELKRDKDMLYALLNSNLVSLKEGQQIMIAYQKAWVDHVAERESKGDQRKKEEIAYKMGKLVDDILMGDSYTGTHVESGKHHKG